MSRAVELENFDTGIAFAPAVVEGDAPDPDRLAAYDEGYAAGWEDALKARAREEDDARAALSGHLQSLAFTFHEARAHVMRALSPLVVAVMETALPRALYASLGERLAEEIATLTADAAETDIRLLTAPGEGDMVGEMLAGVAALPFDLSEDAALAPGQIHLRMGNVAREIDLSALQARVLDALAALDTANQELLAHG